MSYGDEEQDTPARGYDPRDAARNPVLVRELLKLEPLRTRGGRAPIAGNEYVNHGGTLIYDGSLTVPVREAMPPGTVTLALKPGFDTPYGDLLSGTTVPMMLVPALREHLQVPVDKFAVGNVYDGAQLAAHVVVLDARAYQDMAKSSLHLLADAQEGADLIGLKNAGLYSHALANEESGARKAVITLLKNTPLTDAEMRELNERASASENYEFSTLLRAHRQQPAAGPGNPGG